MQKRKATTKAAGKFAAENTTRLKPATTLPKDKIKIEYIEAYRRECDPAKVAALEKKVAAIEGIDNKIKFLDAEIIQYQRNIDADLFYLSGAVELPNFPKGEPILLDKHMKSMRDELRALRDEERTAKVTKEKKKKQPAWTELGRFCALIQDAGIVPKRGDDNTSYCMRVCEKYNLPYADNVRQNYTEHWNPTRRQFKQMKNKTLPLIDPHLDAKTKKDIDLYLNNKEKLYA
jgi:hypothetical protein